MNPTAAIVAPLAPHVRADGILSTVLSPVKAALGGLAGLGLSTVAGWVIDGARSALIQTAHVIGVTTTPQLSSAWFSSTYWRVSALAALLTVPFLCAAAIQAVLSSNLATLLQAGLFHLPVAMIGVSLAAPVVMLLLAATDQMCSFVSGAGIGGGANFLAKAAEATGTLTSLDGSFFAVAIALFTAAAAIVLMIELLIREAAVYVVVLMLPLVFAALVWPARRIWAIRLLELLLGLILSKFAIVAVMSLAGAAFGSSGMPSVSRSLAAMSLVLLSTFAPWAMLRLLPFAEVAAGAGGSIRGHAAQIPGSVMQLTNWAADVDGVLAGLGGGSPGAGQATDETSGLRAPVEELIGEEPGPAPETPGDGEVPAPSGTAGSPTTSGWPEFDDGHEPPFGRLGSRTHEMGPEWQVPEFEWPPTQLGPGLGGGAASYRDQSPTADPPPPEEPGPPAHGEPGPPAHGEPPPPPPAEPRQPPEEESEQ